MKIIVRSALSGAIRMLVGNAWWMKVQDVVKEIESADIEGEEKKSMAITILREGGWVLAAWALNLTIEIAVAVLFKLASNVEVKQ